MQNKNLFQSGIKNTLGAIPLMFIGPIVIHNAWMNKHTNLHYIVLAFGIIICLFAMFLMWKGILKIMKSL
jgi:hypothetical protein